jgi:hypothetical protein
VKLSDVSSQYGAPMGRRDRHSDPDGSLKFRVARVRLNGDYDSGGAYWGAGAPLYQVTADDAANGCDVEFYLRAADREHAKQQVTARYPNARFYR